MTDQEWGDPENAPYWAAAERGALCLQRCDTCRGFQHYARPFCVACGGRSLSWDEVEAVGTVYSATRNWLKVTDHLEPPYVVALVDLDAGPRMMAGLQDGVAIGARVAGRWQRLPDGRPVLHFTALRG